jgi:hypothetical protein
MDMGSQICRKGSFIIITPKNALHSDSLQQRKEKHIKVQITGPTARYALEWYPCSISHRQCEGGGKIDEINGFRCCEKKNRTGPSYTAGNPIMQDIGTFLTENKRIRR